MIYVTNTTLSYQQCLFIIKEIEKYILEAEYLIGGTLVSGRPNLLTLYSNPKIYKIYIKTESIPSSELLRKCKYENKYICFKIEKLNELPTIKDSYESINFSDFDGWNILLLDNMVYREANNNNKFIPTTITTQYVKNFFKE